MINSIIYVAHLMFNGFTLRSHSMCFFSNLVILKKRVPVSYHFTCSVLTISVMRLIPSSILLISLSPYSISLHPLTLLFHSVHLHLTGLRCINFLSLSQFLPYISFLFHSLDPTVHLLLLSLSFSLPYIFPSSDRMIFRRPQGG